MLCTYHKKIVILHHVLVRGDAINRESGVNPEQTRYCNSPYSMHNS